jgi:hypothetical protein
MLRHVALVRNGVSEEHIASIIRVTIFVELGKTLVVTSNRNKLRRNTTYSTCIVFVSSMLRRIVITDVPSSQLLVTLMIQAITFSKTSVLTGATRYHIARDGIIHSHRRENLKAYIALSG